MQDNKAKVYSLADKFAVHISLRTKIIYPMETNDMAALVI
jgi:hypothetical protein